MKIRPTNELRAFGSPPSISVNGGRTASPWRVKSQSTSQFIHGASFSTEFLLPVTLVPVRRDPFVNASLFMACGVNT
jgi:hypothetical protein